MRYQVGDGSSVLVEVDEDTYGVEAVSRTSEGVLEAGQRLESALGSVRDAAQAALDTHEQAVAGDGGGGVRDQARRGGGGVDREDERRGPLHGEAVVVSG